jgi:hypothetical protein
MTSLAGKLTGTISDLLDESPKHLSHLRSELPSRKTWMRLLRQYGPAIIATAAALRKRALRRRRMRTYVPIGLGAAALLGAAVYYVRK